MPAKTVDGRYFSSSSLVTDQARVQTHSHGGTRAKDLCVQEEANSPNWPKRDEFFGKEEKTKFEAQDTFDIFP